MAKALAKPSACFHLRWARVGLNAGLAQIFLFVALKRAWRRQKKVEEASALPRKEDTNAQLQRLVFFSKQLMYEPRARFARASCQPVAHPFRL